MTTASNKLGRYQIIREIARSNDIVYEAMDPSIGRRIALKELQLPANLVGSAKRERIERFYREAKAAGALLHPNIVTIFEVGEESGRHFIAMEFLEGQNLQDQIEIRGSFPAKEAVDVMVQVLEALDYAHSRGIVHRDIKPANIQILPGGKVKLTDFGIARIMHEPSITQSGQIFGTPSYMSPEQVTGKDIDPRSDIFSVGVVLYEAICGTKPFTGDNVVTITYNIMNTPAPRPEGVPQGLLDILDRAMAKSPDARFQSAREMIDALKSDWANAGYGQPAPPPPIFFPGMTVPPDPQQQSGGPYSPFPTTGGGYPQAPPPVPPGSPPGAGPQTTGIPGGYPGGISTGGPSGPLTIPPTAHQPFPAPKPRQPVMSPQSRSLIFSVILALLLGGGLLASVFGVTRAYESYQQRQVDAQAVQILERAQEFYNQGQYEAAIREFKRALQMNISAGQRDIVRSNIAVCYQSLGQRLLEQGRLSEAVTALNEANSYIPNSGNTLYLLGLAYEQANDASSAVSYYEQAISRDPMSEGGREARLRLQSILYNQGRQLLRANEAGSAYRIFQEVVELDPTSQYGRAARTAMERILLSGGR